MKAMKSKLYVFMFTLCFVKLIFQGKKMNFHVKCLFFLSGQNDAVSGQTEE